jgi:hypothetical protein
MSISTERMTKLDKWEPEKWQFISSILGHYSHFEARETYLEVKNPNPLHYLEL